MGEIDNDQFMSDLSYQTWNFFVSKAYLRVNSVAIAS
jgi:hypothetical protein